MSSKPNKHNKKRSTALVYEFIVRRISEALVSGDKRVANSGLRVIKRHFKPGTELYREFRLANALMRTRVSSQAVAASILQEAKVAARSYNAEKLEHEKTSLIHEVNRCLGPDTFDLHVESYKMLSTIQVLISDWRQPHDLERQALYEDRLVEHLTSPAVEDTKGVSVSSESPGTTRMMMSTMMDKLNERYSGVLNSEQKSLLRAYALSSATDDPETVKNRLLVLQKSTLARIDEHRLTLPAGTDADKLARAREVVANESFDTGIDDATVTRFMTYSQLGHEITNDEGEKL
jgi:hypothetical protein